MRTRDIVSRVSRVERRLTRAAITVTPAALEALAEYLNLLARWNASINLTALDVATPADAANDRLIVEPLAAARRLRAEDHRALDIGSGGGSPAVPLKIVAPRLRLTMVESKVRKAAFLREVVRTLALTNTEVENHRVEELLARPALHDAFDVVTMRAVRGDAKLWQQILPFVKSGGRVFWFRSSGQVALSAAGPAFAVESHEDLVTSTSSALTILSKP